MRAAPNIVRRLVEQQEAGGYTLPAAVLADYDVVQRVAKLRPPAPQGLHPGSEGLRLVEALAAGEDVDIDAVAQRIHDGLTGDAVAGAAQRTLEAAREAAADRLTGTVRAHADEVMAEHLRPAHEALLEKARAAADVLAGRSLDDVSGLLAAPAKVREAYVRLRELTDRRRILWDARKAVLAVAGQAPEHDVTGLYVEFRSPHALHPGLRPEQAFPGFPRFDDPVRRLIWLATDATPAEPWFPTQAEADQRWSAIHGPGVAERRTRRGLAVSVGARGAFVA